MPTTCREVLAAMDDDTDDLHVVIAGVVVPDDIWDAAAGAAGRWRCEHLDAASPAIGPVGGKSQPGPLVDASSMDGRGRDRGFSGAGGAVA